MEFVEFLVKRGHFDSDSKVRQHFSDSTDQEVRDGHARVPRVVWVRPQQTSSIEEPSNVVEAPQHQKPVSKRRVKMWADYEQVTGKSELTH